MTKAAQIFFSIILAILLCPPVFGVVDFSEINDELSNEANCKTQLESLTAGSRRNTSAAMNLSAGMPILEQNQTQDFSSIDQNTQKDLDLENIFTLLDNTLTEFGKKRLQWRLHNTNLSPEDIERFQRTFKFLTENRSTWGHLRKAIREATKNMQKIAPFFTGEHPEHSGFMPRQYNYKTMSRTQSMFLKGSSLAFSSLSGFLIYGSKYSLTGEKQFLGYSTAILLQIFSGLLYSNSLAIRKSMLEMRDFLRQAFHLKDKLKTLDDPLLRSLGERLEHLFTKDEPVEVILKKLNRVLGTDYAFAGDWVLGQGLWTLRGLQKRIQDNKYLLAEIFSIFAEIDYLTSTTLWIHENNDDLYYAEVRNEKKAIVEIEEGHHPHLVSEYGTKSVPNTFKAQASEDKPRFFILTGPNMGGKSTYVRMVATILLLSQMGIPVPAKIKFRPMHIMTNMDISDSIVSGKSYFDSETDRLKIILEFVDTNRPTFFGLDEILLGTNSEEREAAIQAFIKYVSVKNHIFILATHDTSVTKLEGLVKGVKNIQVETIRNSDETINFTRKVIDGRTRHRNALQVLKDKNFPDQLLRDANKWIEQKMETRDD